MHKALAVYTLLVLAIICLPSDADAAGKKRHHAKKTTAPQQMQIRLRIIEVTYPAPRKDLEGQPHVQKKYPWELRVCPTVVS